MAVRFKCDFDKFVVLANLERRGWEQVGKPGGTAYLMYTPPASWILQSAASQHGVRG
jgi:hypothetical protein